MTKKLSNEMTILELARSIVNDAERLDAHFLDHNLPQPSHDVDAPPMLQFNDPALTQAHEHLLTASRELYHLARGPQGALMDVVSSVCLLSTNRNYRHFTRTTY